MRRNFSSAAAVAFLTLVAAGLLAHEPTPAATNGNSAVRDVLLNNAKGFEAGDLKLVDGLWSHDADVTVFEGGHANYGWADYRHNHLKPELQEMKNVKYQLSDITTRVDRKIAWATFKYTISANVGERRVEGAGLGTAVLENREGGWKIVHWHTSAPRRTPGAPPQTTP
jgi:ketosteroid isomerase-like protein